MFTKNGPNEDVKRTLSMLDVRRKLIDDTPAKELPKTYAVNQLADALHPGFIKATIKEIKPCSKNSKVITLSAKKFPYFRAGQYVTISVKINGKVVTRPYSIMSSPNDALMGKLELGVQTAGYVSTYLTTQAKVGETVLVSEPIGDFHHDSIRDEDTIYALAGGSGITPFVSMIKAIIEGSENFKLVILYGVKSKADLMLDITKIKDDRIKIIPVYSDEKVEGAENGFLTKELIKKYLPEKASIFMCGANLMYQFVKKELAALQFDLHQIRSETNCAVDQKIDNPREFNLIVHMRDEVYQIKAKENESLLVAMERAGLAAPSRCRGGHCGFCHSRLIKGSYVAPKEYEHRRLADFKFKYIHPCSTYPSSDMEIDVPPVDELKEF
ncbi:MAG: flavin reductase family protein [Bacilli bacterium]|nr:flavin reductase family protein [Bacilli bacterium]